MLGRGLQDANEKRLVEQRRQELHSIIDAYRDIIHSLYVEYPRTVRDEQTTILRDELSQRNRIDQAAAAAQIAADIAAIQRDGDLTVKSVEARLRGAVCATDDGRQLWQDACKLPLQ